MRVKSPIYFVMAIAWFAVGLLEYAGTVEVGIYGEYTGLFMVYLGIVFLHASITGRSHNLFFGTTFGALFFYVFSERLTYIAITLILLCLIVVGWVFLVYEKSRPSSRRIALVASLTGFSAAGRVAMVFIPNGTPVDLVAFSSGFALGGPTGFVVGALSMFLSNFFLGQGPWTPYQMVGAGVIGLSGALFRKFINRENKVALACVGVFWAILYDLFLNLQWVTMNLPPDPSVAVFWRYFVFYSVQGIHMGVIHVAVNVILFYRFGPAVIAMLERYARGLEVEVLREDALVESCVSV